MIGFASNALSQNLSLSLLMVLASLGVFPFVKEVSFSFLFSLKLNLDCVFDTLI